MPPNTKMTKLKKRARPVDVVASFFDCSGAAASLHSNGFTAKEYYDRLITIARNSHGDPYAELSALKQIRRSLREDAELNGAVVTGQQSRVGIDSEGREIREAVTAHRITSRLQASDACDAEAEGVVVHDPDNV